MAIFLSCLLSLQTFSLQLKNLLLQQQDKEKRHYTDPLTVIAASLSSLFFPLSLFVVSVFRYTRLVTASEVCSLSLSLFPVFSLMLLFLGMIQSLSDLPAVHFSRSEVSKREGMRRIPRRLQEEDDEEDEENKTKKMRGIRTSRSMSPQQQQHQQQIQERLQEEIQEDGREEGIRRTSGTSHFFSHLQPGLQQQKLQLHHKTCFCVRRRRRHLLPFSFPSSLTSSYSSASSSCSLNETLSPSSVMPTFHLLPCRFSSLSAFVKIQPIIMILCVLMMVSPLIPRCHAFSTPSSSLFTSSSGSISSSSSSTHSPASLFASSSLSKVNLPPRFTTDPNGPGSEIVVVIKEGPEMVGQEILRVSGEDPDGDELTFGIESSSLGSEQQLVKIANDVPSRNSAAVFLNKELDRETKDSYSVTLTLTDGKLGRDKFVSLFKTSKQNSRLADDDSEDPLSFSLSLSLVFYLSLYLYSLFTLHTNNFTL